MRHYMWIGILFLYQTSFAQQNWKLAIDDPWYREFGSKGLKVGDKMPDISLGTMINNYTGMSRFSDFEDKLIILDFWDSYCASCIAAFPKMEELQNEFGNKIQIILVNTRETAEQIKQAQFRANFDLPNLPCIVAESPSAPGFDTDVTIKELFPLRGVPHHVWIKDGFVKLIGGFENTYSEKIQDCLDGRDIFALNNMSNIPTLTTDTITTYHQLLGNFTVTPLEYGSFVTKLNNEVVGIYPAIDRKMIVNGRIVRTLINVQLVDLYRRILPFAAGKEISDLSLNGEGIRHLVLPKGIDTLLLTTSFKLNEQMSLKDTDLMKSVYCYEQVLPSGTPDSAGKIWMIEDLNRYFSLHLGIIGGIEKLNTSYYAVIKDNVHSSNRADHNPYKLIETILKANPVLDNLLEQNRREGRPWLLLNETGMDSSTGKSNVLKMKDNTIQTVDELDEALKRYGYKVEKRTRDIEFIVFKTTKPSINLN